MTTDNKSDDTLLAQGVAGTSQESAGVSTQLEGYIMTMSETLKTLGAAMESLVNRQGETRPGDEGPPAKPAHKESVHETDDDRSDDDDLMDYIQPKAQTGQDAEPDEDLDLLNGIEMILRVTKVVVLT